MSTVPIYWRDELGWRRPPRHEGNTIAAAISNRRWACLTFERGYWREGPAAWEDKDIDAWVPLRVGDEKPEATGPLPVTLAALHHSRAALDRAIAAVEKLAEGRKDWQ